MWIFCGGMKRAGSTLQYQIASHLVEGVGRGRRMPWSAPEEFQGLREKHSGSPEWLVLKSHECTPEMGEELLNCGARGFCTTRDLRDVIASQMLMLGIGFEDLWAAGFLRECVEQHAAWTALPGMAVMKYEDIVSDPPGHVQRIAAHLDTSISAAEATALAADYSPANQRVRIENAERSSWQRVAAFGGELRFDPHTLLHHNHLNSGRAGAWAEVLSDRQRDRVEHGFADWLLAHGYEIAR